MYIIIKQFYCKKQTNKKKTLFLFFYFDSWIMRRSGWKSVKPLPRSLSRSHWRKLSNSPHLICCFRLVYSLIFIRSTRLNNLLFGRNFTRIFNFTTTGNVPLMWHSEHLNRAEPVKDSFEAAQASERRWHKRSVGCNVIVLHRNNLKWFKVQTACSSTVMYKKKSVFQRQLRENVPYSF